MKNEEEKPFVVVGHRFIDEHNGLYTYEITFNQSLVHTGRHQGIEDGLNAYRKQEYRDGVKQSWKDLFYYLGQSFKALIGK